MDFPYFTSVFFLRISSSAKSCQTRNCKMIEKNRIYDDYLHYYTDNHGICQIAKLFLSEASSKYISAVFLIFLAVFCLWSKKWSSRNRIWIKKPPGNQAYFEKTENLTQDVFWIFMVNLWSAPIESAILQAIEALRRRGYSAKSGDMEAVR